ncbi:uncharacterized protein BDV17DRAFT_186842 [Aspergillus undulatus]|uniref:uncharacterized protein n=1 Tax=Aspergillus undulatus TaxID=1810928 RepID=UPI003CCD8DC6
MPSQNLLTAQKFISYFATLDESILEPLLAENYYHEFGPRSLNFPGPFERAGFLAHTRGLKDIMTGFPVSAKWYIESADKRQVIVHATSKTQFRESVKDDGLSAEEWEYGGEYVFFFTMDESGEKVAQTYEFLDSQATVRLMGLIKRAKVNLETKKNHGEA